MEEAGSRRPTPAAAQRKIEIEWSFGAPARSSEDSVMLRFKTLVPASLGILALLPAMAAAQFTPAIVPPNPLYQHPAYRFQFSVGPSVQTAFGRTFVGMTAPATRAPQYLSPYYGMPTPIYSWSGRRSPVVGIHVRQHRPLRDFRDPARLREGSARRRGIVGQPRGREANDLGSVGLREDRSRAGRSRRGQGAGRCTGPIAACRDRGGGGDR